MSPWHEKKGCLVQMSRMCQRTGNILKRGLTYSRDYITVSREMKEQLERQTRRKERGPGHLPSSHVLGIALPLDRAAPAGMPGPSLSPLYPLLSVGRNIGVGATCGRPLSPSSAADTGGNAGSYLPLQPQTARSSKQDAPVISTGVPFWLGSGRCNCLASICQTAAGATYLRRL